MNLKKSKEALQEVNEQANVVQENANEYALKLEAKNKPVR